MKKPLVYSPDQDGTVLMYFFDTPVVIVGRTWLPLVELATLIGFTRWSSKRYPERNVLANLGAGALHTLTTLGSEWCHNLAHVLAAHLTRRPMDALRITWGMPLCVYYDLEDADVSPLQHIARALGGPIFNLLAASGLRRIRATVDQDAFAYEMFDVALGANLFILAAGVLPYPGLDGGVLLKWGLVQAGRSPFQADQEVRRVAGAVGAGLAGTALSTRKRRPWLSALLALLGLLGIGYALGILREE